MKTLTWLTFFLVTSAPALAQDDCRQILLDQSDPEISGIPVWNQGATPSCYMYSSSFMATAWIRKHWPAPKNFVVDPHRSYEQLMQSSDEVKAPILDAENGRTCMSLRWLLKGLEDSLGKGPALAQPACAMFGFEKTPTRQTLKAPSEFKKRMKELLARKELFSIEYCSGVLFQPGAALIKNRQFGPTLTYLNSPEQYENFDRRCDFHVSVVVGQAMRGGKCQIRIRNSWGTGNGVNGYNWVDADDLSRNTLRVVTFE